MASFPLGTECKLNTYKTFRGRPERFLNYLFTFNLCPVYRRLTYLFLVAEFSYLYEQNEALYFT